jgi:NADP-dependent 3-hydroxy acid dehydrogenase YdfG
VRASFEGSVGVVTGASQGIGLAIATCLAAEGMKVWMVARRDGALRQAAASIKGDVVPLRADLSESEGRERLVSAVHAAGQGLNVLVNNAGTIHLGPMADASEDDFVDQLTANVVAPYALTRQFLPMLTEARGDIVFVNSSAGRTANPGSGQFSATQHAVRAFAESLRAEINPDGVRVTLLHPGRTATPRQEAIYAGEGRPYEPARLMQPEDVAEVVTAVLRLPRTAEVTEVSLRSMLKP